jgi:hypothetical protein
MNTGIFILMIILGPLAIFLAVFISLRRSRKLIDQLVESFQPQLNEANLVAQKIQVETANLSASGIELQKTIETIRNGVDIISNFRSSKSSQFSETLGNYNILTKIETSTLDRFFISDLSEKEAKIELEFTTIKLTFPPEQVKEVLQGLFGGKAKKSVYPTKLSPKLLENLWEQTSTKTPGRTLH